MRKPVTLLLSFFAHSVCGKITVKASSSLSRNMPMLASELRYKTVANPHQGSIFLDKRQPPIRAVPIAAAAPAVVPPTPPRLASTEGLFLSTPLLSPGSVHREQHLGGDARSEAA